MSAEEQVVVAEEKLLDGSPKMKEAKLASERKRSRGLGEDKSFKLFSGMANRALAE
jgi:hypothetical protein